MQFVIAPFLLIGGTALFLLAICAAAAGLMWLGRKMQPLADRLGWLLVL